MKLQTIKKVADIAIAGLAVAIATKKLILSIHAYRRHKKQLAFIEEIERSSFDRDEDQPEDRSF